MIIYALIVLTGLRRAGERASRGRVDHLRGLGEALGDGGSAQGGVQTRSNGRDLLMIHLSMDQLMFRLRLERESSIECSKLAHYLGIVRSPRLS